MAFIAFSERVDTILIHLVRHPVASDTGIRGSV